MHELIESIRAAVAESATAEQKAVGAQACRTLLAALDAQPGKPIVLPGAPQTPQTHQLSGLTLDQVLDLVIARLTPIATARESQPAAAAPVVPRGLHVPFAPMVPRGTPGAAGPARRKP